MIMIDLAGMLGKSSGGAMGSDTAEHAALEQGIIFRDIFGRQFGGPGHSSPETQQAPELCEEQTVAEAAPIDFVKDPALLEALQILAAGEMLLTADAVLPTVTLTDDAAGEQDAQNPDVPSATTDIKLAQGHQQIIPAKNPLPEIINAQPEPDGSHQAATAELTGAERRFAATKIITGERQMPAAEKQPDGISAGETAPADVKPAAAESPALFDFTGDTTEGLAPATEQASRSRAAYAQKTPATSSAPQEPAIPETPAPDKATGATTPEIPITQDRPRDGAPINPNSLTDINRTTPPANKEPTIVLTPETTPAGLNTANTHRPTANMLETAPETVTTAPSRPDMDSSTATDMPREIRLTKTPPSIDMPQPNNQPPVTAEQTVPEKLVAQPPQPSETITADLVSQPARDAPEVPPPPSATRAPTERDGDKSAAGAPAETTNFAEAALRQRNQPDGDQSRDQPQDEEAPDRPAAAPARRAPGQAADTTITSDFHETVRTESRPREVTDNHEPFAALNNSRSMPGSDAAATAAPTTAAAPGAGLAERVERLQDMLSDLDKHVLQSIDTSAKGMVIRLVPANLGRVQLSCQTDEDQIKVEMLVENGAVRSLIQQQENNLRELLHQAGYRMDQFDVRTQSEGANARTARDRSQTSRKPRAVTGSGRLSEEDAPAATSPVGYRHHHEQEGVWFVA